jgi:5-methylcytosine-specific restriction protein A
MRGFCSIHKHLARRKSSAKRGYDAKWRKLRVAFLGKNSKCKDCKAPATHVDHIVPKKFGGTDSWSNLQALCHRCHSIKTAKSDGGFGNPVQGEGASNL